MDSTTPEKPNPNLKNVYLIGGIPVEFPYEPYGSQLAFMGRVIATLNRGEKLGHCHALLESPTGTGKSLALLCAVLAWQQHYKKKNLYSNFSPSKQAASEASSEPHISGGGFLPEMEPWSNIESAPSAKNSKKGKTTPTIYFASRTHSQISQLIREYRKTYYRVPMAILASRKHYCTNKRVRRKENIEQECKLLFKGDPVQGVRCYCSEYKNVHEVKAHPSLQKGGCNEAHDIEDLVKLGQRVKGCPYFAARSLAQGAELVFCPYNYIINKSIRKATEVDLTGSIVILDEAHNLESIARDAGSVDVEEDALDTLEMELEQLCSLDSLIYQTELEHLFLLDSSIYQPLYDTIQGIIGWIGRRKSTLVKHEFQHYFSCWTGENALEELQEAGISQQDFPILLECAKKAIKEATDADSDAAHLSGSSVITLEGLFSSLDYLFSENGLNALHYQLVLQRYVKRDVGDWMHSLSVWCLKPAVVFKEIADEATSVILTSGTLSPMNSFSSELGVQFETCMEAPHVIDVESQLLAAVVSNGPGKYRLNASYKTSDVFAFQDELGASLEEIFRIVPGGALVFFPSYKLMEMLQKRWCETGQWSRLNAQKSLFVEPRGNQDSFDSLLKDYYNSISQGKEPAPCRIDRDEKRGLHHFYTQETCNGGAAFLAVFRGKVSEGIDFSDDNARVVVIVGIPFPNIRDIQVALKKKYNDTYWSSKNLLTGDQWYRQQAFRAMNQAAGRCIRHRFDYGAVIFMDERYREDRNINYISKWLRKSIKHYDSFDKSLEGLQSFFQAVKEQTGPEGINTVEISDIKEEDIPSTNQKVLSEVVVERENTNSFKLDSPKGKEVVPRTPVATEKAGRVSRSSTPVRNNGASLPKLSTTHGFAHADETETVACRGFIDLECCPQKNSRSESKSVACSTDSLDQFTAKGNSGTSDNISMSSPAVLSREENANSTEVEATNELSDQQSVHLASVTNSNEAISHGTCATPERFICNLKPDLESPNLNVNSHTPKRRKQMISLLGSSQMDQFRTPDGKSQEAMRSMSSSRDATRRIEFGVDGDCAECNKKLSVSKTLVVNNCSVSCLSSDAAMNKRLHICCSFCKNSLGLPENHYLVMCSLSSSSKVYLKSFLKSGSEPLIINEAESIPVVICDLASVDQRLRNRSTSNNGPKHGTWSEIDGCVFGTIFCPFCTGPGSFLGVEVMACDAPNSQIVNKILFCFDRLEIKNLEALKDEPVLLVCGSDVGGHSVGSELRQVASGSDHGEVPDLYIIDKFFDVKQEQDAGSCRTTKSKGRIARRLDMEQYSLNGDQKMMNNSKKCDVGMEEPSQ